jgi:hypothetical protein
MTGPHPKGAAFLVCAGTPVNDRGQPVGAPCGRQLTLANSARWTVPSDEAVAHLTEIARAGGWAVSDPRPDGGRDVMCPSCRRPDPELIRLTRELIPRVPRPPGGIR